MVAAVNNGEAIVVVALASKYHKIIFPLPPLTVFSKVVKSKVAVPFPSSQREVVVAVATGKFATVKSIATGVEVQSAFPTTA